MAQEKRHTPVEKACRQFMPPAQIFVGAQDILRNHTVAYLQALFCPKNGCHTCAICTQIKNRQFYNTIWIEPEKNYTLDDLDPIRNTLSFKLEDNENLFFVIQKADLLSDACTNALLKSVEEPPHGYHFIFLASRLDPILPTLRSRCITQTVEGSSDLRPHEEIFTILISKKPNPAVFFKALESSKINEAESLVLIDQLLAYWAQAAKNALTTQSLNEKDFAQRMIAYLQNAITKPPMPGSSKIFWRNIFMGIVAIKETKI